MADAFAGNPKAKDNDGTTDEEEEEEPPAEFTCAVCFDLLTMPAILPHCPHRLCRLCCYLMMEAHLRHAVHQPWYAPPPPPVRCPRCRATIGVQILLLTDMKLAEAIRQRFPKHARAKAETTHAPAREVEAMFAVATLSEELAAVERRRARWALLAVVVVVPVYVAVCVLRWAWRWLQRAAGFLLRLGVLVGAWRLGLEVGYHYF